MKNIYLLIPGVMMMLFISCKKDDTDIPNSGTFIDNRDDQVYNWVRISEQIWMAENLAYLPAVSPSTEGSTADPYYYVYDYEGSDIAEAKATDNYSTYGVLYNWPAAMDGDASSDANPGNVQGVCPSGWHLPGNTEWTELIDSLGGEDIAGGKLKEAGFEHWMDPNTGADNSSGFTGLPGGYRYEGGEFAMMNRFGCWWSATEESGTLVWRITLHLSQQYAGHHSYFKDGGFSVRCIKDE